MIEIDRGIILDQVAGLIAGHANNSSLAKDDVSYATDLAWRNKWDKEGRVVSLGNQQTHLIYEEAHLVPALTVPGDFLPTPLEERAGKARPSFIDSLYATEARLAWLEEYLQLLPESVEGVISGGSMSYGRFHNVRSDAYAPNSDLDLIVVTAQAPQPSDVDNLLIPGFGFQNKDREPFRRRLEVFQSGYQTGEMEVLQHKFSLPKKGFDVDMHIVPLPTLTSFLATQVRQDVRRGHDTYVPLQVYTPGTVTKDLVNTQLDFYGSEYRIPIKVTQVPYGAIHTEPSYFIASKNFTPGPLQNLCSPMFEVAFDRNGKIGPLMHTFQTFMYEGVDTANVARSGAAVSNTHLRNVLFSRHIKKEIDRR